MTSRARWIAGCLLACAIGQSHSQESGTSASIILQMDETGKGGQILRGTPPIAQDRNLTFSNISSNSVRVTWEHWDGYGTMLLCAPGTSVATPSNGTAYPGDSNYGSGTRVRTSSTYSVFRAANGDANPPRIYSVLVTGLQRNTTYTFKAFAWNDAFSNTYNTDNVANNPLTLGTVPVTVSQFQVE